MNKSISTSRGGNPSSRRGRIRSRGFALVELIIIIAIIAILVSLATHLFLGYSQKANITKHRNNLRVLENVSEHHYNKTQSWPRLGTEPYTAEQINEYCNLVMDYTGEIIELDPSGNYYDIDYDALSEYVKISEDDKKYYILQNPAGKVYYMIGLTDKGEDRVPLESDGQGNIGNRTLMNFSFLGNSGSNTITDVSGNNIIGTLVNFNHNQNSGWTNEGIRFDGSNDYIRIPNTYREFWTPTEEITVNIRACADNWQITKSSKLISCTDYGGWAVSLNSSGWAGIPGYLTLDIKVEGQPASWSGNPYHTVGIPLSEIEPGFHTFTLTFDRRYSRVYMDGELKGSLDIGKYVDLQYPTCNNALLIGTEAGAGAVPKEGGEYFKGTISHVSIYDRCLHPDEVRRVYLETK